MKEQGRQPIVTRTLEPGLTYFSAAEINVVLMPVGNIPLELFNYYISLVMKHRQVELSNVQSFFKSSQKSPFNHFPWKNGTMNFRFLPEEVAGRYQPMACLHAHRHMHAAIGIISCEHAPDSISEVYDEFEKKAKEYPEMQIVRCLAFNPNDVQITQDAKSRADLVMFPPGYGDHLMNHMEVVMHDFAACMLSVFEQKMLTLSPGAISLTSFVDSAEFLGSALSLAAFAAEDEAQKRKRKYARVQKLMGDYSLLAGSPLDAMEHYNTAIELSRVSQDWIYTSASVEGYITGKMIQEAIHREAFLPSESSIFHNEEQWRSPSHSVEPQIDEDAAVCSPSCSDIRWDMRENKMLHDSNGTVETRMDVKGLWKDAQTDEESIVDEYSSHEDPFSQKLFWDALRSCDDLKPELEAVLEESKSAIRRRGAISLLVETEVRYARLLAGLYGVNARKSVMALASSIQLAAELLPLPEDRLIALSEAASVLGLVGANRKRVLLLWQTVELSKYFGFPDERTLAVARNALEPAAASHHDHWSTFARPLSQDTCIPDSWGMVKTGILEATLGLAIYAKRHADVWDAAAALLREHCHHLSSHRIQSLYDNLKAAGSQMSPKDKARPGKGPPPILYLTGPCPLDGPHSLHLLKVESLKDSSISPITSPKGTGNPFLYDAFAARRKHRNGSGKEDSNHAVTWVCGEPGKVEVEICNPCPIPIKVERLVLEASYNGTAATKAQWKSKAVSINVPSKTKPVKIVLEGTPLVPGEFQLLGCRVTAFEGVSWWVPWSQKPENICRSLSQTRHCFTRGTSLVKPLQSIPQHHGFIVCPALPFAHLGFVLEQSQFSKDSEQVQVPLLQGQNVKGTLILSNMGPVPIHHASLKVVHDDDEPVSRSSSRVHVELLDADALASCLPLEPGDEVHVPIEFSSAMGWLGSCITEELIPQEFLIEYAGDTNDMVHNASLDKMIGRCAQTHLVVALEPSISFVDLAIERVWANQNGHGDIHDQQQWDQRALMLVGIANKSTRTFDVWMECELGSGLTRDSDLERQSICGKVQAVKPGERCVVPFFLPNLSHLETQNISSNLSEAFKEIESKHIRFEERERQVCATILAECVVLKFTCPSTAASGTVRLPKGEIYNSLSSRSVSLIRDCALKANFELSTLTKEPFEIGCWSMENGKKCISPSQEGGLSGYCLAQGGQLKLSVNLKNRTQNPLEVHFSMVAHRISFVPVLKDDDKIAAITTSNEAPATTGLHETDQFSLGAVWSGISEGNKVILETQEMTSHNVACAFIRPGWYMVTLADARIHAGTEQENTMIDTRPALVYIKDVPLIDHLDM